MILCGIDLSPVSDLIIKAGAAVARKQGKDLLLATVLVHEDPKSRMLAELRLEQEACMSTHSRDVAASLVLGSQAQAILQHSRIPVVLVPPDRES
jgi:nucleotide-binding universal stress UspA family protein